MHRHTYPEGIRFGKIDSPEGYNPTGAYGQSKLANILHARELTKRLQVRQQRSTGVHRGARLSLALPL